MTLTNTSMDGSLSSITILESPVQEKLSKKKKKKQKSSRKLKQNVSTKDLSSSSKKKKQKKARQSRLSIFFTDGNKTSTKKTRKQYNPIVQKIRMSLFPTKRTSSHPNSGGPNNTISRRSTFSKHLSELELAEIDDDFAKIYNEGDCDDQNSVCYDAAEKERISDLLQQLEDYESSLDNERKAIEEERLHMELKKQSFEDILDDQVARNNALEMQVKELKSALEDSQQTSSDQERKISETPHILSAKIEVMRDVISRQEDTILSFHNSTSSLSFHNSTSSFIPMDISENDEDSSHEFGDSSVALDPKGQGERLRLQSSLNDQLLIVKQQNQEIESLRQQLKDLEQYNGVQQMKKYISQLEEEKKYFVAELEKAKGMKATEKASYGFLGMSASNHTTKTTEDASSLSLCDDNDEDSCYYGSLAEPEEDMSQPSRLQYLLSFGLGSKEQKQDSCTGTSSRSSSRLSLLLDDV